MSHPAELPRVFLDRSLGRHKVPSLLRKTGLDIVTLAEVYGVPGDEKVSDTEWLERVGREGWVALTKDVEIRRNQLERERVATYGVRVFCLSRQDLTAEEMANRFLRNLKHIVSACREPGPFIYEVHKKTYRKDLDMSSVGAMKVRRTGWPSWQFGALSLWLVFMREAATTTGCRAGIGSKRTRRPGERGSRIRRRPRRLAARHRL